MKWRRIWIRRATKPVGLRVNSPEWNWFDDTVVQYWYTKGHLINNQPATMLVDTERIKIAEQDHSDNILLFFIREDLLNGPSDP